MKDTRPARSRWVTAVAVGVAVVNWVVIAFLPRSWEANAAPGTGVSHDIASVTVLRPELCAGIELAALAGCIALVSLAIFNAFRRDFTRVPLAVGVVCLGPVAVMVGFVRDPAPWQIHGEARASDRTTYCFAESSFLQGQTLILARVRTETVFTRTLDPLVATNGDSPRSYLLIVRPTGCVDGYGQVLLTESGWVLGLRSENRCFFAYDRNTGQVHGYTAVEQLSPFLALTDTDEPHEPDVASIASAMATNQRGAPTTEALRGALGHANPHVREAAAQLLKDAK